MEDVLKKEICNFCINSKSKDCMIYCEQIEQDIIKYKCENYIKDESKIIPFDRELDKMISDILNTKRKYVI